MGVDSNHIYNRRRDEKKKKSNVFRAQRDIRSILEIRLVEDKNRCFTITYNDEGETLFVEYTTETVADCGLLILCLLSCNVF